jgi:hypothetical protein
MRVVEITLLTSRDDVSERFTIAVHRKRADTWVAQQSWDVMGGSPEGKRRLMIEDGDRIVIDTLDPVTMVYDKEQMVATPIPIDEKAKEEKEVFTEEQKELHERNVKRDEERSRAEEEEGRVVRTNIGTGAETQPPKRAKQPEGEATPGGATSSKELPKTEAARAQGSSQKSNK